MLMPASETRVAIALPITVLLLLGLVVTASSLGNGFAYDDLPIIANNSRVQTLGAPWSYALQSYWPQGLLHRPVTIWLFALQWQVGGGAPVAFHLVNVLLYLTTIVAVYLLARRLLPNLGAWVAAALFAIHPVHTENTANVVGQSELLVGLIAVFGTIVYLDGRSRGSLAPMRRLALMGLLVVGALAKEQGLMLPFLLLAVELTVVTDSRPWPARIRSLLPVAALMAIGVGAVLVLRFVAIGLSGGMQAIAIENTSLATRALTMLGVIPEWGRLLLWPAHLQADYGPLEIVTAHGFGWPQMLGVAALGAWALGLWWSLSRNRVAGLGLLWLAVALLPVSNVLVPTGIVLAERTLHLPSVGVVLVAGALLAAVWPGVSGRPSLRWGVVVAISVLLALGGWHSARRVTIWHDNDTLFAATVRDAPGSYLARYKWARHRAAVGDLDQALLLYRQAADLFREDPRLLEDYAQALRQLGDCRQSAAIAREALVLDNERPIARGMLFHCLLRLGLTADAREVALAGIASDSAAFAPLLQKADSALRAGEATTEP